MKKSDVDAPRPEHSPAPSPRDPAYERLLSLLENASSGAYVLDVAIWREVAGPKYADRTPPAYTVSLDAALTLVPEGWRIAHLEQRDPTLNNSPDAVFIAPHNKNDDGWQLGQQAGVATTLSLAICIAALRARAAK